MNKQTITTILFVLLAMVGQAQEIKKAEATASDYIKLLNKQGYNVCALDLSAFEKDKYLMSPVIQVWSKGKLEQNILEDFGMAYTNSAPKITVGLIPQTDSLFMCNFLFDDVCGLSMTLPKHSVRNEADGTDICSYSSRPFAVQPA